MLVATVLVAMAEKRDSYAADTASVRSVGGGGGGPVSVVPSVTDTASVGGIGGGDGGGVVAGVRVSVCVA